MRRTGGRSGQARRKQGKVPIEEGAHTPAGSRRGDGCPETQRRCWLSQEHAPLLELTTPPPPSQGWLTGLPLVSWHQIPPQHSAQEPDQTLPLKGYIPSSDASYATEIHNVIKCAKITTFLLLFFFFLQFSTLSKTMLSSRNIISHTCNFKFHINKSKINFNNLLLPNMSKIVPLNLSIHKFLR